MLAPAQAQLVTIAIVSIAAKLDGPDMVEDLTRFQVSLSSFASKGCTAQIRDMQQHGPSGSPIDEFVPASYRNASVERLPGDACAADIFNLI